MNRGLVTSWKKYGTRRLAVRAVRGLCGSRILRATSNQACDPTRTIVICGSPRSGTTWLAETLSAIPRSAILFEPEHVGEVEEARAAGLTWHTFKEPGESWPEGEQFFRKVLGGKVLTPWTTSLIPLHRAVRANRWIVKLVDANFFLGWLFTHLGTLRPILLLRHPCAVVKSQVERGWGQHSAPKLKSFSDKFPQLDGILDDLADHWEYTAAFWCMQTYAPLALRQPFPFHIVFYENIVANPEDALEPVFCDWGIPMPKSLSTRAGVISQTVDRSQTMPTPDAGSTRWQRELTHETRSKILDVVRRFGLDFYGKDVFPDQSRFREVIRDLRRVTVQ